MPKEAPPLTAPLNAVDVASKPRPAALAAPIGRMCVVCGNPVGPPESGPESMLTSNFCGAHRQIVMTSRELKAKALDALERNAFRYAELHMAAAEIAAQRGDARPAEWGLLHTRAVETVKGQSAGSGVVVQIGIALPGLGKDPSEVRVALAPAATEDDEDDEDDVVEAEVV